MQMTEAARLGTALRRLRLRYELSQREAGELANTHQQTWQRYEAGDNDALLKVTLQRRLAEAIGSDHEEFLLELANLDPPRGRRTAQSVYDGRGPLELPLAGRARAGPQGIHAYDGGDDETFDLSGLLGDDARVLRLAGESMIPYAEPGGFVTYNLKRYPRRGQGCVIELTNGDFYVKRYERMDDDRLIVTELHPVEREVKFPLAEVKGLYAVGLRGD